VFLLLVCDELQEACGKVPLWSSFNSVTLDYYSQYLDDLLRKGHIALRYPGRKLGLRTLQTDRQRDNGPIA